MSLLILVALVGCAASAQAPVASRAIEAPNPRSSAPLPPIPASAGSSAQMPEAPCEQLEDALAASKEYGEQIATVAQGCAERLARGPCDAASFEGIAIRYQKCFGDRQNPDRFEGRIDALPRMSEPGLSPVDLGIRLAAACEERCATARRLAIAQAHGEAGELCAKRPDLGRKLCKDRAKAFGDAERKGFLEDCLAECDESSKVHQAEVAREARRPRNQTQSLACFRQCVSRCTGGRVVPGTDGTYHRAPDDWCGTCEFTCRANCAVR